MKKNKFKGNFIYFILIFIFILGASAFLLYQYDIFLDYNNKLAEVKEKINVAKKEGEELKSQVEYKTSNEYIEKMAREKFGMVRPNEIVFIDKNK